MDRYQAQQHMKIAHDLLEAGKLAEAAQAFERVATQTSANEQAPFMLGIVHIRMGEDHKAITALKLAIKVMPDFKKAHGVLGALYEHQNRHDLAKGHIDRAAFGFDIEKARQIVAANRPVAAIA